MTNAEKRQAIQKGLTMLVVRLVEKSIAFEFYHLWVDIQPNGPEMSSFRVRVTEKGYQVCFPHPRPPSFASTPEEVIELIFPSGHPKHFSLDTDLPKDINRIFERDVNGF